jgi:hypothetical protein
MAKIRSPCQIHIVGAECLGDQNASSKRRTAPRPFNTPNTRFDESGEAAYDKLCADTPCEAQICPRSSRKHSSL